MKIWGTIFILRNMPTRMAHDATIRAYGEHMQECVSGPQYRVIPINGER